MSARKAQRQPKAPIVASPDGHVFDDETYTRALIAFQQARALVDLLMAAAEGGDIQSQGSADPQNVFHVFSLLDNELNRLARQLFPSAAVADASDVALEQAHRALAAQRVQS